MWKTKKISLFTITIIVPGIVQQSNIDCIRSICSHTYSRMSFCRSHKLAQILIHIPDAGGYTQMGQLSRNFPVLEQLWGKILLSPKSTKKLTA